MTASKPLISPQFRIDATKQLSDGIEAVFPGLDKMSLPTMETCVQVFRAMEANPDLIQALEEKLARLHSARDQIKARAVEVIKTITRAVMEKDMEPTYIHNEVLPFVEVEGVRYYVGENSQYTARETNGFFQAGNPMYISRNERPSAFVSLTKPGIPPTICVNQNERSSINESGEISNHRWQTPLQINGGMRTFFPPENRV